MEGLNNKISITDKIYGRQESTKLAKCNHFHCSPWGETFHRNLDTNPISGIFLEPYKEEIRGRIFSLLESTRSNEKSDICGLEVKVGRFKINQWSSISPRVKCLPVCPVGIVKNDKVMNWNMSNAIEFPQLLDFMMLGGSAHDFKRECQLGTLINNVHYNLKTGGLVHMFMIDFNLTSKYECLDAAISPPEKIVVGNNYGYRGNAVCNMGGSKGITREKKDLRPTGFYNRHKILDERSWYMGEILKNKLPITHKMAVIPVERFIRIMENSGFVLVESRVVLKKEERKSVSDYIFGCMRSLIFRKIKYI